jgi:hypothetical protein
MIYSMWRVYGGESDGDGPTPEQVQRWARRVAAPENEFPAPVGVAAALAQTGDVAVGLTQVEAFSTGFRFTLSVRLRQPRPDLAPGGLFMLVSSSHSYPGVHLPLENRLLLGLEYADGRRTSNLTDPRMGGPGSDLDEERLLLVPQGGGGSDTHLDQAFWVSPLPPRGPVTVVLTWPVMGLAESRTVIDGDAVTAAASGSLVLWPDQPPQDPPPQPPPPRPTGGWFAEPPS